MVLELMPYRACYPLFKLVYSAAVNAIHNMGLNESSLIIKWRYYYEKLKPRAQGPSYPIKIPTCRITIVLKDISINEEYYKRSKYAILCLKNPGWLKKKTSTQI
ncbi:hypothetical protein I3843_11G081700 [Carya illinoinensis]|nr:hypothetical protein I3843_11G081700 [Carya illinoinensis]